ncbi:MAG: glycosyltransferase family 4 protein [Syntrophomonadaceae bacterium]|jgi:glycosyltransferase involved in cell wall biosynthesis
MKIALLSPIAWRTPPRHYGPWELVVSNLTEELVKLGHDVTLYATGDSITAARLEYICPYPYEENRDIDPKVWEIMHIAHLFENAPQYDIIHNHYDFVPLAFSRMVDVPMVTTIHGFSSPKIIPIYREYNRCNYYISISNADRHHDLTYFRTVYHGIDLSHFTFCDEVGEYLLYLGRIHPDKGTEQAIEIAQQSGMKLFIAGIIQDKDYYNNRVAPHVDNRQVIYVGSVGPAKRDELLRHAYAVLHPISFKEPFGLTVVEAMACGTPVIAFNKGSMSEVINDGVSGFLVQNVAQACNALPRVASLNRHKCREWVEINFSRQRMARDYQSVYQDILRGSR